MLGVLLDHRYRVLETLSKGGFGQTYIAEDTRRPGNPKCLVKHLTPASHEKEFLDNARRLFQMEAVTLERLGHHDQIPRLLAYFEDNAEFYLVQELVNGHPISREIIPGQPWNEPRIIRLLHEVLKILVFVHDCGVIHRDIKPDNLLRRYQDQKIVLVDFGSVKQIRSELLAQNEHQITRTISIGTIGYMATEQSRGKPRLSSDVYSLGIIGIQAATGLNPNQFQEDNQTGELIWRNSASQISAELAAILTRMVCYHFKDRYKSAQDALFDVKRLLGIEPSASMDATVNGGWSPSSFSTVSSSQSNSSTSDALLPPQASIVPTALSLPENGAANGHANSEVATHEPQAYKSDLPLTVLSGIPRIDEAAEDLDSESSSEPQVSSEPEVYLEPESSSEPESAIESESSGEPALNVEEEAAGAIAPFPLPNASPMTEMSLSPVETEPPLDPVLSASSTVEPEELVEPVQSIESTQLAEPVQAAESTQVVELTPAEATRSAESTQSIESTQTVESSHLANPLEAVEST
ncbi:MAG: protein kinase, partial [Leptolyngbyaceae bacterium]|nr:protein kinase [Leptolyngbyaceae bacterium]